MLSSLCSGRHTLSTLFSWDPCLEIPEGRHATIWDLVVVVVAQKAAACIYHGSSHGQGHSCKIGNTDLLGTSKNQNHQLCEICHFCLIFTLQQCIVAQKLIRQPYSSFSQHFVACLWEFFVPRRHRKKYTAHLARKSILSAQIKCKRHHLMLKSMSRSIYVLFFHFHLVHVQWLLSPRDNVQKSPFSYQIFISNWN